MDDGLQAQLGDQLAALRQRVDMAVHGLEPRDRRALGRQQMVHDLLEMLADDMQSRFGQQVMDIGHPPGHRIVDGDHREIGAPVAHGGEGLLEGGAGQRRHAGLGVAAGEIGIGAGRALKGDGAGGIAHGSACRGFLGFSSARARSRSAGVSTPKGAMSTSATSMRMPASSARNCSSFSHCSSLPGGSLTKRSSAARR